MKKTFYAVLVLLSVTGVTLGSYKSVKGQSGACYSINESGEVSDLSELCNSEESSSLSRGNHKSPRELMLEASELVSKGQHLEAMELTDKALEIDPNYAEAYIMRGSLFILTEGIEQAIEEVRKGEVIFEERGDSQQAEIMKQFGDDLQYSLDSGEWEEELEEARRIEEEDAHR